jgi:DNA-binding NarL/FixJ family response regulator
VVPLAAALTLRRRSLLPVLVGQRSKSSLRHAPDYRLGPQHPGADLEPLTMREAEVAALVAQGMTNRQIATALYGSSYYELDKEVLFSL